MFARFLPLPYLMLDRFRRRRPSGVLSTRGFAEQFCIERSRTDRNGLALSILVARGCTIHSSTGRAVARILLERKRGADAVGTLESGRIAVLLPDTNKEGAQVLARDLRKMTEKADPSVDFEVQSYPEDGKREDDEDDHENGRSKRRNGRMRTIQPRPRTASAIDDRELAFERVREFADMDQLALTRLSRMRRAVDIVISGSGLIVASPIFLAVAGAIKLTSRGPVFFRQKRAGCGGRPFDFYKFRSMHVDAEEQKEKLQSRNESEQVTFKIKKDPRVTALGRFLRKTSLDELPQLWNILKGDMTLVGPRPPTLDEVPRYENWQSHRLSGPVGLICIREVSGRSKLSFEEWVRSDLHYLKRRSLAYDAWLLIKSVYAVVSCRGAY